MEIIDLAIMRRYCEVLSRAKGLRRQHSAITLVLYLYGRYLCIVLERVAFQGVDYVYRIESATDDNTINISGALGVTAAFLYVILR